MTGVAFNPSGTELITTSQDGTARLFVLAIDRLIELARARLTCTWTQDECQQFLHLARCPDAP